jgi:predicted ATP-binding protein involved in virulence
VYLKNLSIENFRGIRKMELELHPKLNVLIGVNGSGKSSVLDAVRYLLTPHAASLCDCGVSHQVNDFPDSDIYHKENESKLSFTFVKNGQEISSITLRSQRSPTAVSDPVPRESAVSHLYRCREWVKFFVSEDLLLPEDKIDISWQRFIEKRKQMNTCILAYFPVHRVIDDVSIDAWTNRNFRPEDAFIDAMPIKTNFKEFFEWFRNREDLENEERQEDKQLSTVRNAIGLFLGTIQPPKIYRRDPLRMIVVKNGIELRIQQLSDGEKCLLVMIGDLARRLAIANPLLKNPLDGEGVVLIDEIDLHLHPQWQRMILPKLTETFSNCQFIVSTHSPQILGEIRSENVFILSDNENGIDVSKPAYEIFGQTSGVLLEDMMKTPERDQSVQNKVDNILLAIERNKIEEAREQRVGLENIAKDIPDFITIDMRLRDKGITRK